MKFANEAFWNLTLWLEQRGQASSRSSSWCKRNPRTTSIIHASQRPTRRHLLSDPPLAEGEASEHTNHTLKSANWSPPRGRCPTRRCSEAGSMHRAASPRTSGRPVATPKMDLARSLDLQPPRHPMPRHSREAPRRHKHDVAPSVCAGAPPRAREHQT
jgi:hypothetical protein